MLTKINYMSRAKIITEIKNLDPKNKCNGSSTALKTILKNLEDQKKSLIKKISGIQCSDISYSKQSLEKFNITKLNSIVANTAAVC